MKNNVLLSKQVSGFTLVELSIVIVIIGLIVAGVTTGSSLVKAAKIRATLQESSTFITAVDAFSLQYNALPGDMTNAATYWPDAANGNGDRFIGLTQLYHGESLGAFQQLALAGLIPGSYTGSGDAAIGVNVPKSSYGANATRYFYSHDMYSNFPRGNSLVLSGASGEGYNSPVVLVQDAHAMDVKIDDGMPYMGKILGDNQTAGLCVETPLSSNPNRVTSTYLISQTTDTCVMYFALSMYIFK